MLTPVTPRSPTQMVSHYRRIASLHAGRVGESMYEELAEECERRQVSLTSHHCQCHALHNCDQHRDGSVYDRTRLLRHVINEGGFSVAIFGAEAELPSTLSIGGGRLSV